MALDDRVRAAVARVKTATLSLLVTVTHEAFASRDGDGTPTYSSGVSRKAFMERKDARVAWRVGMETVPSHMITFLETVTVTMNDRITLPDGSAPPIIEVTGVRDPDGGNYFTQVIFGRPERGVTVT